MRRYAYALVFVLAGALARAQEPELPKSVFDAFADASVSKIDLPAGKFRLTRNLPIISRSLTVNGTGCTLFLDPAKDWVATGKGDLYPLQIASTTKRDVIYSTSENGYGKRYYAMLTGKITKATTQLVLDEASSVQPGETVLVHAGVNITDPQESHCYIPAKVKSVDVGGIVTFEKPLGIDVPLHLSYDAIKLQVNSGLHYRVGPWGTWISGGGAWQKGLGDKHGLERFTNAGGMVSGVVLNDITMELVAPVSAATMTNGAWLVSTIAANNVTVNNLNITNLHGVAFHNFRSFGTRVNTVRIIGEGLAKVDNTKVQAALAFTAWGGDDIVISGVDISCNNTVVMGTEVSPGLITLDGVKLTSEFNAKRDANYTPSVFGFFSSRTVPRVNKSEVNITHTGGVRPEWFTYADVLFDTELRIGGTSFVAPFDLGYGRRASFDGVVNVGGVEYGPLRTETITVDIPYSYPATHKVYLPAGLYLSKPAPCRLRVLAKGDLRSVNDSYGNSPFFDAASKAINITPDWKAFSASHWHSIGAGDAAWTKYKDAYWYFSFASTTARLPAKVQYQFSYLPKKL